ncbi:MAG TPA: restriction endonuclease [Thermodesulfobacteriota bacterium]
MQDALRSDQIIIGWSEAAELLDPSLEWEAFRDVVRKRYYRTERNPRKAGNAAGHLWRFIREMKPGDLVVIPYGAEFYVAEVTSPATHDPNLVDDDTAFRRKVKWLNDKRPIPRGLARSSLQSRMKIQGTCAWATDVLEEIKDCLALALGSKAPTFDTDLHDRLVREALQEIRSGRLNDFGFESLLKRVLEGLGAEEVRIIPRAQDKGADLLATFRVAGAFRLRVAVQAKHYRPEPPVGADVVDQLIKGIEAESAELGKVVTSGTIADSAVQRAAEYYEDKGIKIELVDGLQLATLIVEHGLSRAGGVSGRTTEHGR